MALNQIEYVNTFFDNMYNAWFISFNFYGSSNKVVTKLYAQLMIVIVQHPSKFA